MFLVLLLSCGDIECNPGPPTGSFLKNVIAVHCNINSLYAYNDDQKLGELELLAQHSHADIIALTETWLDDTVPNQLLSLNGFQAPIRKDRNRHGGGVLIYCSEHLPVILRPDLSVDSIEATWLQIQINRTEHLLVAVYYRPPNQSAEIRDTFLQHLHDTCVKTSEENHRAILIMGDFNDRCKTWLGDHSNSELGTKLLDLVANTGFTQIINEPTHLDNTGRPQHLLDLIITDSPDLILNSHVMSPIARCHHCPTLCNLTITLPKDKPYKRTMWDFKHADIIGLNASLHAAPWYIAYDIFENTDDLVHYWTTLFYETVKEHIPCREITIYPKNKPWVDKKLKLLFRKRSRLWRRYKKTKNPDHFNAFRTIRNLVTRENRRAKCHYFNRVIPILENPNTNAKQFWSLTKSLLNNKSQSGIPPLAEENSIITDCTQKAELFNHYFAKQTQLPPHASVHPLPDFSYSTDERLSEIVCTPNEILKILASLNPSKATGPDTIGNYLLKITAASIAEPLSRLFNHSLNKHTFPACWKQSNIVPIHKKNSKQDKSNYRPVSLLCNISKVFERVVHNRVYDYLISNELLTDKNSGFKKQDSTINQLLGITEKIYKALENRKDVRMVFLDLSKAFDRVWHKGLIFKLKRFGITGPLLLWFESYLEHRCQRVIINGQHSNWLPVEAGVPQGSILGPLLFLVFINDIVNNIQCDINLFADDTSLLEVIDNPEISCAKINSDLAIINDWATQWLMLFNVLKTIAMTFTLRPNPVPQPLLYLNGSPVTEVKEHCHLGLTLTSTMKWNAQINNICNRASQRNNILRKFKFKFPRKTLESLYIHMIRPILEYADVIYDNCGTVLSQKLESIQYDAARTCLGALSTTSRTNLLNETGWDTLAVRRQVHKTTFFYKIINNLVPTYLQRLCPPTVAQMTRYNLRNRNNQILIPARTTRYRESFLPSTTSLWNSLPLELRNTETLEGFKRKMIAYFSTATPPPSWYSTGYRYPNILHTRLRLDNTGLNSHLFKYGRSDICACACGHNSETMKHYLLECPNYATPRDTLLVAIRNELAPRTNPRLPLDLDQNYFLRILLCGSLHLSNSSNNIISAAVQQYIISSGRFSRA